MIRARGEEALYRALQLHEMASAEWIEQALEAVKHVSSERDEFTTDDLWPYVSMPKEPRAMGAVMRAAVKAGYCTPTDRTVKSERKECHARPLRVWRSEL